MSCLSKIAVEKQVKLRVVVKTPPFPIAGFNPNLSGVVIAKKTYLQMQIKMF
jgi:hypothetical protein